MQRLAASWRIAALAACCQRGLLAFPAESRNASETHAAVASPDVDRQAAADERQVVDGEVPVNSAEDPPSAANNQSQPTELQADSWGRVFLLLGVKCYWGEGVPQDDARAVYWYRFGANRGNAWAQYNLGWMYESGRGVREDNGEAVDW